MLGWIPGTSQQKPSGRASDVRLVGRSVLNRDYHDVRVELRPEMVLVGGAEAAYVLCVGDPPPTAVRSFGPTVIIGIAACIGIMVGSIGPWLRIYTFDLNGVDIGGSGNVTLTLGAASGVVLATQREVRIASNAAWAIPLLYGASVAGVACLSIAVATIVRFASTSTEILGAVIDVRVGWGLWLVAFCSAGLSLAGARVAVQASRQHPDANDSADTRWSAGWTWAAVGLSAIIVLYAVIYTWADVARGSGTASLLRLVEHLQH